MYLRRIHIENNGPLKTLAVDLPFNEAGAPKPLLLVGQNGSGKTNFLSIVGDALFEAAAHAFDDLMPASGAARSWFRVSGGPTISRGATGSFTVAVFEHEASTIFFREHAGTYAAAAAREVLHPDLAQAVNWSDESNVKSFDLTAPVAQKIFASGAYAYFPASRAEEPHWLNGGSTSGAGFNLRNKIRGKTHSPIFVEAGLARFTQWLLAVLMEAAIPLGIPKTDPTWQARTTQAVHSYLVKTSADAILKAILGDTAASFAWAGRRSGRKLGIAKNNELWLADLSALSGGQATLLSIFGTLLSYADDAGTDGAQVEGICVVDEIDAHMHVDLQHRAIPALIAMFPKIQFILSSHSPLLPLGLRNRLGGEGFELLDMPTGASIAAEAFSEFEHAFQVLRATRAFSDALRKRTGVSGKLLVLVEGETDPSYLKAAASALGRTALLEGVEIEWVGAKDPVTAQGYMTGKDALNQAAAFLSANPAFLARSVLLLADNDTNKLALNNGRLYVRKMPDAPCNSIVTAGIESYLPEEVFRPEMFDEKTRQKSNGSSVVTRDLNKMRLCEALTCEPEARLLEGFAPALDLIQEVADLID